MKYIRNTILSLSFLAMFSSCEKDLEPYDSPICRLNFIYLDYTGNPMTSDRVNDATRHSSYSFIMASVTANEELKSDTVWFDVSTMGFLSDIDRPIRLEQVTTGDNDAIPGVHYVAFDDPSFISKCFVPANQNQTRVPVVVLRDASLQDNDVNLTFRLSENEYFKSGYDGLTERTLQITDRLSMPSNWPVSIFGTYGQKKHELMIEWTNQAWDESYIREILNGDTGYISYLQEFFRQKLGEENAARIEAGLGKYTEANGTEVSF